MKNKNQNPTTPYDITTIKTAIHDAQSMVCTGLSNQDILNSLDPSIPKSFLPILLRLAKRRLEKAG